MVKHACVLSRKPKVADLSSLTKEFSILNDICKIVYSPLHHRVTGIHKRASPWSKRIVRAWRNFGIYSPHKETVALKVSQGCRQHLLRDIGNSLAQFREAHGSITLKQLVHQQQRPFVTHPRQNVAHRAVGKQSFGYNHVIFHIYGTGKAPDYCLPRNIFMLIAQLRHRSSHTGPMIRLCLEHRYIPTDLLQHT